MIGQKRLKDDFMELIQFHNFPKSSLLVGPTGSGKRIFAKWIADTVHVQMITVGSSVNEVRDIIELSNRLVEPVIYVIPEIEQMSASAQNALLKMLEEPPNNAFFVLTAVQPNMVLSTILSRCVVFYMDLYSSEELFDYAVGLKSDIFENEEIRDLLRGTCFCPGEVNTFLSMDVEAFLEYSKKVFDNIAKVSGSNAFKIADKLNFADDTKKFDLGLFWKAFLYLCSLQLSENPKKYADGINITLRAMQNLRVRGVNKQMCFDVWLIQIRRAWLDASD